MCLLFLLLGFASPCGIAGGNKYRSGILASISLMIEHWETIIWAIIELERIHRVRYDPDWYYQMLVKKPAKNEAPGLASSPVSPRSGSLPPSSGFDSIKHFSFASNSQNSPEDDLVDDLSRMQVEHSYHHSWLTQGVPLVYGSVLDSGEPMEQEPSSKRTKRVASCVIKRKHSPEEGKKKRLEQQVSEGRNPSFSFFIENKPDFQCQPRESISDRSPPPDHRGDSSSRASPSSSRTPPSFSISPGFYVSESPTAEASRLISFRNQKRQGKNEPDGYFVGDTTNGILRSALKNKYYFGPEFEECHPCSSVDPAIGRKDRTFDFLEIKFRVLNKQPGYKFGLKKGMVCAIYPYKGRYFELCAPFVNPLPASLASLAEGRYVPINHEQSAVFAQQQESWDEVIIQQLQQFENAIYSKLQDRFVRLGDVYSIEPSPLQAQTNIRCIGRGQCAVVWQLGNSNLVFRRYAGHTKEQAEEQAWVQEASYATYEQLAYAHEQDSGKLKLESDIGLPQPMSLFSTRVYSRFISLPSLDGSYSLYEIQPLIPREELVEHYLDLFMSYGSDSPVELPLYELLGTARRGERKTVGLREVMRAVIASIVQQLAVVSKNLAQYQSARRKGSLNIGIDAKIANYQVRFTDESDYENGKPLEAYVSNYDGYPPNLSFHLADQQDDDFGTIDFSPGSEQAKAEQKCREKQRVIENALFRGGPLYDLLNDYFKMFGFTWAFVERSTNLTTLNKQLVKMLASIANEYDARARKSEAPVFIARATMLEFFMELVNEQIGSINSNNRKDANYDPDTDEIPLISMQHILDYQKKSAKFHQVFRIHLMAAEIGAMVNPRRYTMPKVEFPVSDKQSQWLKAIRDQFSLHIMAFFHWNDINGLHDFLMAIVDDTIGDLPGYIHDLNTRIQNLNARTNGMLSSLLASENTEAIMGLLADILDSEPGVGGEQMTSHSGQSGLTPWVLKQCQLTGSCSHSNREHQLYHQYLQNLYLARSISLKTSPTESDISNSGRASEFVQPGFQLAMDHLNMHGIAFQQRSTHQSYLGLLSDLLRVKQTRMVAAFRNALRFHQRRKGARQDRNDDAEKLLQALQRGGNFNSDNQPTVAETVRDRNLMLLASMVLDRPFIWVQPSGIVVDPQTGLLKQPPLIRRYELKVSSNNARDSIYLEPQEQVLSVAQLRDLVDADAASQKPGHYFIFADPAAGQWSILDPGRHFTESIGSTDPDIHPHPLLTEVLKANKIAVRGHVTGASDDKVVAYRSFLNYFLTQHGYRRAGVPTDHFCLLRALLAFINYKTGSHLTLEAFKAKLRMFLARLLMKLRLNADATIADFNLLQAMGLDFLLLIMNELTLTPQDFAGPFHSTNEVWGDYNLIVLAAVTFNIEIPFLHLNVDTQIEGQQTVIEHHVAMPDGQLQEIDLNTGLIPGVMLFFDDPYLNHWDLAFQFSAAHMAPFFHWLPVSEPEISHTSGTGIPASLSSTRHQNQSPTPIDEENLLMLEELLQETDFNPLSQYHSGDMAGDDLTGDDNVMIEPAPDYWQVSYEPAPLPYSSEYPVMMNHGSAHPHPMMIGGANPQQFTLSGQPLESPVEPQPQQVPAYHLPGHPHLHLHQHLQPPNVLAFPPIAPPLQHLIRHPSPQSVPSPQPIVGYGQNDVMDLEPLGISMAAALLIMRNRDFYSSRR